jgi:excisionase family DNA binding protein
MSVNARNTSPTRLQRDRDSGHISRVALAMEEAATSLGISRTSIYQLAKEGKIQVVKIGRRTLVPVSEVDALMARLQGLEPWVA